MLTLLLSVRLCLNFGLLIYLVLLHGVRQIGKRLHGYMYEFDALRSLYLGSHLFVVLLFEDIKLLLQVLYIVQSLVVAHLDDFLGYLHAVMGHFLQTRAVLGLYFDLSRGQNLIEAPHCACVGHLSLTLRHYFHPSGRLGLKSFGVITVDVLHTLQVFTLLFLVDFCYLIAALAVVLEELICIDCNQTALSAVALDCVLSFDGLNFCRLSR